MRKEFLLLALLLLACTIANPSSGRSSPVPELSTATLTIEASSGTQPAATTPPKASSPISPRPSATNLPVGPKTPTAIPVLPLTLQVKSPADESIVQTATIPVLGTTSPNAVVSVNGQLANVESTGNFQLTISLDEGPNIIEVDASDLNGDELSTILSVIYQP